MWYTGPFAELHAELYKRKLHLIANCNPGATEKNYLILGSASVNYCIPRLGLGWKSTPRSATDFSLDTYRSELLLYTSICVNNGSNLAKISM